MLSLLSCTSGDFVDAIQIYDSILETNPTNLLVRKRKAAIWKAKGQVKEAVEELLNILKFFPGDAGTWLELADLYVVTGNYKVLDTHALPVQGSIVAYVFRYI